MNVLRWLAALWWLLAGSAAAAPGNPDIVSIRTWEAPAEADNFAQAQATLRARPADTVPRNSVPNFELRAGQPTWFALELPAVSRPSVLEFTHPSLRNLDLFLPEHSPTEPAARSGRDLPAAQRLHHRFPGAVPIAASKEPRVVYLRVLSPVPARGDIQLLGRTQWETLSRLLLAAMALGFGTAALAALYALGRAAWHRSPAYLLYSLLTLTMAVTVVFMTGLGEGAFWPRLSAWHGQASALTTSLGAGLTLLLIERAFALEISAPRFALALRVLGVLFPLAGLVAFLLLPLPAVHLVSRVFVVTATGMGLAGFWLGWRTSNPIVGWLLAGYVPLAVGVCIVALATARVVPYSEWVMLALPLSALLQIPFCLHGLRRLEARRDDVRHSRRHLETVAGPDGESREEVAQRLGVPPAAPGTANAGATLMLLRFEGLAPGTPTLAMLDTVVVERYLHGMMKAGLRPGSRVGRWSFHELLLRDLHNRGEREINGLITALFAQSMRGERFGLTATQPQLRIAFVRVLSVEVPVRGLARQLARALDHPMERELRRIELDPWVD